MGYFKSFIFNFITIKTGIIIFACYNILAFGNIKQFNVLKSQNNFRLLQNDSVNIADLKQKFSENLYSKPDDARNYALSYLQLAQDNNKEAAISDACKLVAITFDIQGMADSAIHYYQKALRLSEKLNDTLNISFIYNNIGLTYNNQGNYEAAATNFYRALELKQQLLRANNESLHRLMIGGTLDNLGILFKNRNQPQVAYEYFLKAKHAYKVAGDYNGLARVSNNLASYHKENMAFDSVNYHYKIALESFQKSNNQKGISIIYNNLASIQYENLNNADSAIYYYEKSLPIRQAMKDQKGEAFININLAEALAAKGELGKAIQLIEKAMETAVKLDMKTELTQANKVLSEIEYQRGNFKTSADLFKTYHQLQSETFIENREKAIEELNAKYQLADKEQTIIKLELRDKENQLKSIKQRQQRNIFLFTSLLLLALFLFAYIHYRQKQNTNKLLKHKNALIGKALDEKNLLLKEIHHRVKNNLQLVSSLLTLQGQSITDDVALMAINEGKSRVRSMALIHQDLYQTDNITAVSAQTYLLKLCKELFDTYNIKKDQVKLEARIEPLNIDVDTLIPIGLIINELITNSLKYAFTEGENGLIQIELKEDNQLLKLTVRDNGKGYDLESVSKTSFGNRLIKSLIQQLDGNMTTAIDNGTVVSMEFRDYKISRASKN